MGSPLASLSATRGLRVKVEPSLSVAVYGRPCAAGDPADSAGAADDAAGAAVAGAPEGVAAPPHAATSMDAAPTIATARREPIRMVSPPQRTRVPRHPGAVSIVSSRRACQRYWKGLRVTGIGAYQGRLRPA